MAETTAVPALLAHRRARTTRRSWCALLVLVLCCGCSSARGPATDKLQLSVKEYFPVYVNLEQFRVTATENTGNKVDPVWQSRFSVNLRLKTETYREVRREGGVVLVELAAKRGAKFHATGKTSSTLSREAWATTVALEDATLSPADRPLAMFDGRVIIVGSQEETAYLAEQKKLEEARLAEQKRLEEARLAEQKRLEEARVARIAAAKTLLVGNWSNGMNFSANGSYIDSDRPPGETGIGRWTVKNGIIAVTREDYFDRSYEILDIDETTLTYVSLSWGPGNPPVNPAGSPTTVKRVR